MCTKMLGSNMSSFRTHWTAHLVAQKSKASSYEQPQQSFKYQSTTSVNCVGSCCPGSDQARPFQDHNEAEASITTLRHPTIWGTSNQPAASNDTLRTQSLNIFSHHVSKLHQCTRLAFSVYISLCCLAENSTLK